MCDLFFLWVQIRISSSDTYFLSLCKQASCSPTGSEFLNMASSDSTFSNQDFSSSCVFCSFVARDRALSRVFETLCSLCLISEYLVFIPSSLPWMTTTSSPEWKCTHTQYRHSYSFRAWKTFILTGNLLNVDPGYANIQKNLIAFVT